MIRVLSFFMLLFVAFAPCRLSAEVVDSLHMFESISVSVVKQGLNLRSEPVASTTLNMETLERQRVTDMKSASALAPNFFIPDYGSRITSSIYVRGIGARIDQPVVGLNIDNVPTINKNGFDLEVMDIERMEILRGPQSTLYGRNTMCGVVNVYTLSPFSYEGVRIGAEYSSGETYKLRGSVYEQFSQRFAASISLYGSSIGGFYTNLYTDEKCESEESWGGRVKLQFRPSSRTSIDNTLSLSTLNQGGYAYKSVATDQIDYNDPSSYERTTVSNGLTVHHRGDGWQLSSITGYQYLDDCMTLDQDFTTESMFTLQQAIEEHSVSEDVIYRRGTHGEGYNMLFGAFAMYDHKAMQAPVQFKQDGIDYLIYDNVNGSSSYYSDWDNNSFDLNSDFQNNTFAAALYHESSYTIGRLEVSAGLRFDFEATTLDYHSYTSTGCYGNVTGADGSVNRFYKPINIDISDKPSQSFFEILPKLNLLYKFGEYSQSSLYGSVSKGYKAGGYNSQMFSDILQQKVMQLFGLSAIYSAEDIISYKPEYSWNYEVGAHMATADYKFMADVSLYYIDCRDQQLTVFPDGMVTGRMMTNAGHSRSYGAELSCRGVIGDFTLNGSYGYTDAKFVEYDDNEEDYGGNYLPYAPQQTLFASIDYTIGVGGKAVDKVVLSVNTTGAGRIYWNEQNSLSQPLYALLGAEVRIEGAKYDLSLWGRNICDKNYNTFYFKSMGNEFVQQGRPDTYGISLNIKL